MSDVLHLPFEVLKLVLADVESISPVAALLLAAISPAPLDSIHISRFRNKPISLPRDLLSHSLRRFSHDLCRLFISSPQMDDICLEVLANSPTGRHLKYLSLPRSTITDNSAALWERFEALEYLNLNQSNQMGPITLHGLGKLRYVEEMELQDFRRCVPWEVVAALLSPESVPELVSLDSSRLRLPAPEMSEAAEIYRAIENLRQRADSGRIRRIVANQSISPSEEYEIRMLCPQLESLAQAHHLPHLFELPQETLDSLKELRIFSDSNEVAFIDLFKRCPNLVNLSINALLRSENHGFDQATSLTSLKCELVPLRSLERLPPSLRSLEFKLFAYRLSEPDFERWLSALGLSCPNLSSLTVTLSLADGSGQSCFRQIMDSLPSLTDLKILEEAPSTKAHLPLLLSMPLLRNFPEGGGRPVSCGYLPSLQSLRRVIAGGVDVAAVASISPATTPNLREVRVGRNEYWTEDSREGSRMTEALLSISDRIVSLGWSYGALAILVPLLPRFSRLTALQLRLQQPEDCLAVSQCIPQLNFVTSLSLSGRGSISAVMRASHPRLSSIKLSYAEDDIDLQLTRTKYPSLQSVALVDMEALGGVRLTDLPLLETVVVICEELARNKVVLIENMSPSLVATFSYGGGGFGSVLAEIKPAHRLTMKGRAVKVADMSIKGRTMTDVLLDLEADSDTEQAYAFEFPKQSAH